MKTDFWFQRWRECISFHRARPAVTQHHWRRWGSSAHAAARKTLAFKPMNRVQGECNHCQGARARSSQHNSNPNPGTNVGDTKRTIQTARHVTNTKSTTPHMPLQTHWTMSQSESTSSRKWFGPTATKHHTKTRERLRATTGNGLLVQ